MHIHLDRHRAGTVHRDMAAHYRHNSGERKFFFFLSHGSKKETSVIETNTICDEDSQGMDFVSGCLVQGQSIKFLVIVSKILAQMPL